MSARIARSIVTTSPASYPPPIYHKAGRQTMERGLHQCLGCAILGLIKHAPRPSEPCMVYPGPSLGVKGAGGKNEEGELHMAEITMKELLEAGAHFGHRKVRLHPRM